MVYFPPDWVQKLIIRRTFKSKWTQLIINWLFFKPRSSQIQNPILPFLFTGRQTGPHSFYRWFRLPAPFIWAKVPLGTRPMGRSYHGTLPRGDPRSRFFRGLMSVEARKGWTKTHGERTFFSMFMDLLWFNQIQPDWTLKQGYIGSFCLLVIWIYSHCTTGCCVAD